MTTLLSLLLLVSSSLAVPSPVYIRDPLVSLSVIARVQHAGMKSLIETDRRRAKSLMLQANQAKGGKVINVGASNFEGMTYTANVGVGNPPHTYKLLVDTGSSNTWIGGNQPYVPTNTSTPTSDHFNITYGSGSVYGKEYIDEVTIAPGAVIQKQSIGVASSSSGLLGLDGILGIGPKDLTMGTLIPDSNAVIPTVTDSGRIQKDKIGIFFEPSITGNETNGQITFGGADSTKFTGKITYTPVTQTTPASFYWGIDQSIKYGSTPIQSKTAGIVDTGTTLVLIASNAFDVYQRETGGVMDQTTGLLRITPAQFSKLQSLYFAVENRTFELTANAQAWPRKLNSIIQGDSDSVYLMVGDIGTPTGNGFDFINGFTFLQRYYSVFDTKKNRVGLAETPYTYAETN